MSEFNIEVQGGSSVRLPTAGKYCDRDIIVTASGGGGTEEIENLIDQSGVLDSTDGTATEKVEQLIDKAKNSFDREIVTVTTSASMSTDGCAILQSFIPDERAIVAFKILKSNESWVNNQTVYVVAIKNIVFCHVRQRNNKLNSAYGPAYDGIINVGDEFEMLKIGELWNGV